MDAHDLAQAARTLFDLVSIGGCLTLAYSNRSLRRELAEARQRRNEWREMWSKVSEDNRKVWRALIRACGSFQAAQVALAVEGCERVPQQEPSA